MKITTIGRGHIGGGLGRLWVQAGHTVTAHGRDGGDAADADAVFVAGSVGFVSEALGKVSGCEGRIAIDATTALAGAMSTSSERSGSRIASYSTALNVSLARHRTLLVLLALPVSGHAARLVDRQHRGHEQQHQGGTGVEQGGWAPQQAATPQGAWLAARHVLE